MSEERTIRIVPIDLDRDGNARDTKLGAAVQTFCEAEFGAAISFPYYLRVWAIILQRLDDPEYFQVIGVTSLRNTPDCPIFHIVPPSDDKEGIKIAEQARDMAVYRLYSYLEDVGQRGNRVLIYVSEKAERYWRRFLTKLKAKAAHRYEMEI